MRVGSLEGHRLWAPTYDLNANPLLALERRAMREQLKSLDTTSILDVGCGTGQSLAPLLRSASTAFGVDACQEMLEQAAKNACLLGRLASADAERLPFPAGFASLVLCSMTLSYVDDLIGVFKEFARVCTPGGAVAISDMHPDAQAAGWTRSFKAGGLHIELDHHCRSWEAIGRAAEQVGLGTGACTSLCFGEPERPIFKHVDKADIFATIRKTPALWLGIWKKPC